jgi:hypothetical protein
MAGPGSRIGVTEPEPVKVAARGEFWFVRSSAPGVGVPPGGAGEAVVAAVVPSPDGPVGAGGGCPGPVVQAARRKRRKRKMINRTLLGIVSGGMVPG